MKIAGMIVFGEEYGAVITKGGEIGVDKTTMGEGRVFSSDARTSGTIDVGHSDEIRAGEAERQDTTFTSYTICTIASVIEYVN